MGVPAPHATRIQPCSAMAGRDAALAHTIGSTLAADHNSCRHFNLVEERGETFRHRFLDGGILRPQLLPDCQKAFPSRQQVTAFGCTHTALAFEYRGRPHLSQRPVKTLAGASVMAARASHFIHASPIERQRPDDESSSRHLKIILPGTARWRTVP